MPTDIAGASLLGAIPLGDHHTWGVLLEDWDYAHGHIVWYTGTVADLPNRHDYDDDTIVEDLRKFADYEAARWSLIERATR